MTLYEKILCLKPDCGAMTPLNRIYCELRYASALSAAAGGQFDSILDGVASHLLDSLRSNGAICFQDVYEAEEMLSPLSGISKSYTVHCVGHAHIDMNWMWGYNETACLTVDTFRTVLRLMEDYPSFTFAQSQASTYRIVEEFAPEMLGKIRRRIKEGRWEVSASTWVESDKNMPTGEALCRHILYTKRYLSVLLDISPTASRSTSNRIPSDTRRQCRKSVRAAV